MNTYLWIEFAVLNIFFVTASFTDIKYFKIYNKFNLIMALSYAAYVVMGYFMFPSSFSWHTVFDHIIGGVVLFLVFCLPAIFTGDAIGGDIKFALNLGLWLGVKGGLIVCLSGIIYNIIYRIVFKSKKTEKNQVSSVSIPFLSKILMTGLEKVPLAPFFYAGYIVYFIYGLLTL